MKGKRSSFCVIKMRLFWVFIQCHYNNARALNGCFLNIYKYQGFAKRYYKLIWESRESHPTSVANTANLSRNWLNLLNWLTDYFQRLILWKARICSKSSSLILSSQNTTVKHWPLKCQWLELRLLSIKLTTQDLTSCTSVSTVFEFFTAKLIFCRYQQKKTF